jgi:hypothetical protein
MKCDKQLTKGEDMEDLVAALVPVAQWEFRLWRVVWSSSNHCDTQTLFCVATDDLIGEECQRRWPSNYYTEYREYDEGEAPRPSQVGTIYGRRIDADAWTAGKELKAARTAVQ